MSIEDPIEDMNRPFGVAGWESGDECDPPEAGKHWLSIIDSDHSEFCVIVHRGSLLEDGSINEDDPEVMRKLNLAFCIASALNARYPLGGGM